MWNGGHDAYLESRILTADPVELINLLYQGGIQAVREARLHLAEGRIAERSREINKACSIIIELGSSLDFERGGEISRRLGQLYDYMQRQLVEANLKQADAPLADVLGLLTTLAEGWAGIRDQALGSGKTEAREAAPVQPAASSQWTQSEPEPPAASNPWTQSEPQQERMRPAAQSAPAQSATANPWAQSTPEPPAANPWTQNAPQPEWIRAAAPSAPAQPAATNPWAQSAGEQEWTRPTATNPWAQPAAETAWTAPAPPLSSPPPVTNPWAPADTGATPPPPPTANPWTPPVADNPWAQPAAQETDYRLRAFSL